ncbi:MAG: DNA polymerase III subunit delta' [Micavibrio sp.]|nr:DNA polymerase III subunit delta' [Micavibrio sp.]
MDLFGEPPDPYEDDDDDLAPATSSSEIDTSEELFSHSRFAQSVIGHEDIEAGLIESFKKGRMHHGLLFTGPKGIGKAAIAYRLARYLLKYGGIDPNETDMFGEKPELPDTLDMPRDERVFRLVASESHPDLLKIERAHDEGTGKTAAGVAVADIRRVNPFLRMRASDGGWRVVVIDDADTMNRNAQNALLKILEEPPAKTLLILVVHRLGALIPTIRSRTQTLTFNKLNKEAFSDLVRQYDPIYSASQIDTLYHLSAGSFGTALDYIRSEALDTLSQVMELLSTAPNWDKEAIHKLGDQLGKNAKSGAYENFTTIMLWAIRELITAKARGQVATSSFLEGSALESWAQQSSLDKLLETWQNLDALYSSVERANLDKKQAVLRTFSILAA